MEAGWWVIVASEIRFGIYRSMQVLWKYEGLPSGSEQVLDGQRGGRM